MLPCKGVPIPSPQPPQHPLILCRLSSTLSTYMVPAERFRQKFLVLLKDSASWNIHSVCPASSIFHLSQILLATASAAGTHTLMQMRNEADQELSDWKCKFENEE